jgi:uncharacterized protein YggU (UPF0235/DUF167 family)
MKINITIKPNSTKGPLIEPQSDGSLIVYVREVAAENQANEALIKLLAKHLNVSKMRIKIIRGSTSRHKLIEIDN